MKKFLSILILTFIISGALVGCAPSESQESNDNDGINGGNDTDEKGENAENDDNNTENSGNSSTEDDKNGGSDEEKDESSPTPVVGSEVGNLFASVTLERIDGGNVSPDDYRGKIVIVNIWATWCPPCKAELPDFNKIANEFADDVVIIAAHDYVKREDAPAYVEQNFPDTKIIFAYDSYYGDAYFAAGGDGYVPFTAILDQNGVIVYSDSGILSYEQLVSMIEKLK